MAFEEIKAGLDKYMAEMDEAKRNAAKILSVKYIVKEHSALINDGNDLFYVYAHYPTTEPDVMVMSFVSKVNAELFCEAMNAENECREADPVKHGHWLKHEIVVNGKVTFAKDAFVCSLCQDIWHTSSKMKYCPSCGAKMDVVNNSPLFNLDKTMEFKVVGDIKPVIRQILGEYEEWESSDCAVHLKGAPGISLPGYYPRLTYYACFAKPKCRLIIAQLYEEGLIELHCVRD